MTIADRKEREKEQRRKDILDSAEKLFFSRGYDNVSMDDIARAVELNKATIYLYFKDKESLFFAVVLRGVRILAMMVKDGVNKEKNGIDKLFAVGRSYLEFAERYPDHLRLYDYFQSGRFDFDDLMDMEEALNRYLMSGFISFTDSDYAKEIIAIRHDILSMQRDAIQAGIDEGDIRQDIDPVEVAVLFTLFLQSIQNIRPDLKKVLDNSGIDRKTFALDMEGLFNDMIRSKKGTRKK